MLKFYETHFEEYINKPTLHPKYDTVYTNNFPTNINDLKNVIFYGPDGTGKYTQALKSIRKYSPTDLKYEKKISLTYNKSQYFFKISDIHYEVDMSQLGCNSKLLWHEIYQQIIDIISAKQDKSGIILCKCYHEIHNELLDNFYSYMQKNNNSNIDVKFFIITKAISFIPDNILNCCQVINISRPPKAIYNKIMNVKLTSTHMIETISNIKLLYSRSDELMMPHRIICNKILKNIVDIENINMLQFREILYDIFIYDLDITECVWYILSSLIKTKHITNITLPDIMLRTYTFFKYYNNNYRPIYHVENYLYFITKQIHNC